jgi:hypothetical protein
MTLEKEEIARMDAFYWPPLAFNPSFYSFGGKSACMEGAYLIQQVGRHTQIWWGS